MTKCMRKNLSLRAVFLVLIAYLAAAGMARTVDGPLPEDPILRRLESALHQIGVDIRNKTAQEKFPVSERPQITRLENFPADRRRADEVKKFRTEFQLGRLSAVREAGGHHYTQPSKFSKIWHDTPVERRIALSFSGHDAALVDKIRAILNKAGFATFVYRTSRQPPSQSASETGRYFAQAGHRYVIDSNYARKSPAVHAEVLEFQREYDNKHQQDGRENPIERRPNRDRGSDPHRESGEKPSNGHRSGPEKRPKRPIP